MKNPNQFIGGGHVDIAPSDIGAVALAAVEYTGSLDAGQAQVANVVVRGTYNGGYETDGGGGFKG